MVEDGTRKKVQKGLVMPKQPGWIGVDLGGTLAYYEGYKGTGVIGRPIPRMLVRVKKWLAEGKKVRIFTARVGKPLKGGRELIDMERKAVKAWCKEHVGRPLPVTCRKDFAMTECWDDRSVTVERNTGRRLTKVVK